ncbi:short-chain dehydrogenase/reductase SDR [Hyaloraphidium curvatum]|nr:short-chain dehydrogenase/reductase SDR [Hyaloraphidium curvatum]
MASQVTKRLVNASTGKGRVCFITGGASGLGSATALAFARNGASAIVLTDLVKQKDLAHSVIETLKKEAGSSLKTLFLEHDVRKEPEWIRVMEETHKAIGPLDVMLTSAGISGNGDPWKIEDLDMNRYQRMIDINLTGTVLGLKYGIRSMKENKAKESKSIITISSIEGIISEPQALSYGASKGGVRIATKAAALYCAQQKYNIRVNSAHPGYIATPMLGEIFDSVDAEARKAMEASVVARHPIGRMGEPREIADGILFLASEESSFMTGSELVIDGGYTAQ